MGGKVCVCKCKVMDCDKTMLDKMLYEVDYLVKKMTNATLEKFLSSEGKKRLAGMTFINIGEYMYRLSDEFKTNVSDFPFLLMLDTRKKIVRSYDALDFVALWNMIRVDLPLLREAIVSLTLMN